MKAWLLPAFTGIESMTLADAPDPTPGPNQLVLNLQFAALNPADRYLAIGQYPAKPAFPHILGRDGIGTVSAIGPNVTGIKTGDTRLILRSAVGVSAPGTLAQKVAVDAAYTVPPPPDWSFEQSAAAPLVYVTAWQALTQWGELPPSPTILITGASGGVGVASLQLARALYPNSILIALSRSADKSAQLKNLGASITLSPAEKSWPDHLKKQLGDKRIDLAIDNIAGETFNQVLEVMGANGRISCVGRLAGPVPSFNTGSLFFRRLKVGGIAIATYSTEESHAAWQSVLQILSKTSAQPLIDQVFPFDQVHAAFARLKEGPMGKVLIRIA